MSTAARKMLHVVGIIAIAHACAVAAADPEKRLRLAQGDIDTLAPQEWVDFFSHWVGVAIFESLYEWDYLARPRRLSPNTASALPEISDDGKTWTIRLTKGIYFTDDPVFKGKRRELVAEDYVYAFKRTIDPNLRPGGFQLLTDALVGARATVDAARKPGAKFDYDAPIEGVRALDRYTLQLRLTEANYPVIEERLAVILAGAREVIEAAGPDLRTRAVGTGPYRLKEWKRGSRIVLEANPDYRPIRFPESSDPLHAPLVRSMKDKRLPQIGVVTINIIEEMQSRLLEFEHGHLDYLELTGEIANRLLVNGKLKPDYASRGIRHYAFPTTYGRYTYFNLKDPIVGGMDKEHISLRRAIALAFDTDALVRVAYAGQALPLAQLVPVSMATHDPTLPEKMPYDPAASRALLDRAGYDKRDRDGYRLTPAGTPLTLTIITRPGALWREWETVWRKSLDAVGLRVQFREMPAQDQFKEMQLGHYQMSISGWGGEPHGYLSLARLESTQTPLVNSMRFALPKYDELYAQMLQERDVQKQRALSREMSQLAQIYVPLVPHVVDLDNDFVQPWLRGFNAVDIPSYWKYLDIDLVMQRQDQSSLLRKSK